MTITYWAPNQASIAQVESYTVGNPPGSGCWAQAIINGKTLTYVTTGSDTGTTVAVALQQLLSQATGIAPELTEITFETSTNTITATAKVAGTPFANVPGTSAGLVLTTGNGWSNGITTTHTTANASPSTVNDPANWLRVIGNAPGVRAIPQNGDNVIISNTSVPLLWNLDQLTNVQFATYQRWQDFEGTIGLPENNPNGYTEWRATYFQFVGPLGSVPAGGLQMLLGFDTGTGRGPTRERYNVGSQQVTLTVLAAGNADDEYSVRFLGVHTANTFSLLGGVSLGIGMLAGEAAGLASCSVGNGTLGIGAGVVWTSNSTLTLNGGTAILNSAPNTLAVNNGASYTVATDALTWPNITQQNGSSATWLAGGVITNLTLRTSSTLDKSQDSRALVITNSTIDGDSCTILDPNNAITFTNTTTVTGQVSSGPIQFTGPRTMKVV